MKLTVSENYELKIFIARRCWFFNKSINPVVFLEKNLICIILSQKSYFCNKISIKFKIKNAERLSAFWLKLPGFWIAYLGQIVFVQSALEISTFLGPAISGWNICLLLVWCVIWLGRLFSFIGEMVMIRCLLLTRAKLTSHPVN